MLSARGIRCAAAAVGVTCALVGSGAAVGQQRIAFPDGSGSITLPPGWRLTSAQHVAAEAAGPRWSRLMAINATEAIMGRRKNDRGAA